MSLISKLAASTATTSEEDNAALALLKKIGVTDITDAIKAGAKTTLAELEETLTDEKKKILLAAVGVVVVVGAVCFGIGYLVAASHVAG